MVHGKQKATLHFEVILELLYSSNLFFLLMINDYKLDVYVLIYKLPINV